MAYKYKPSTKKAAMWGHTANIKSFQKGGKQVYTGSESPKDGRWRTINGHPVFIKGGTSSAAGASPKSGMKKGIPSAHKPLTTKLFAPKHSLLKGMSVQEKARRGAGPLAPKRGSFNQDLINEGKANWKRAKKSGLLRKPFGDVGNRVYD